jgi:hypothetical protein
MIIPPVLILSMVQATAIQLFKGVQLSVYAFDRPVLLFVDSLASHNWPQVARTT